MAATNLPQAVAGNTFNAANEMTSFNGTPMTYDANGNLTNDGTNTYAWDARNHLVGISGGSTASFVYDADGRRALKSINGTTTQFLYDGLNPVQELQNGAPSANMLTGLGIDEFFQRTDSAGVRDYLSDILGSTLALTDSSGTKQTSYLYNPFGTTTASGQGSSNPFQFTGRENDGAGLYFYRARYLSPALARFISQDPAGFSGGMNLYEYTGNDPVNDIDPIGQAWSGVNCEDAIEDLGKAIYNLRRDVEQCHRLGCTPGHEKEMRQHIVQLQKALDKVEKYCGPIAGAAALIAEAYELLSEAALCLATL
jgi:RHS repeat-associated protein